MKIKSTLTLKLTPMEVDALISICLAAEGSEMLTNDAHALCFELLDTFIDRTESIELGATLQ